MTLMINQPLKTALLTLILSCAGFFTSLAATDQPTENDMLQVAYEKPGVAQSFVAGKEWFPLPAYEDRKAWDELLGKDARKLIKQGESLLDYEWKVIPATAYLAFERTGDRRAMENPEGANRGALIKLILAELAEGKGRFIDQIANGVWQASQQYSWVLSAHQSHQRSKRALPDMREHFIDLASGRYGSIVSIAYHFFHKEFDKLDPSISYAVEEAVKRNILDPYLDPNELWANWWLGDWQGARTDRKDDFWGNPNTTAQAGSPDKGTKSIFDPCPKGWMVASPTIYKEVIEGKESAFETNGSVQSMIYKYDGINKAYWHFSGLKWASSGGNPNNNMNDIVGVWSNSSYHGYDASDHNVYQIYYRTSQGTWSDAGGRAAGMSVRCMKDNDNR